MKRPGIVLAFTNPSGEEERFEVSYRNDVLPSASHTDGISSALRYRLAPIAAQLAPNLLDTNTHRFLATYEIDDLGRVGELRSAGWPVEERGREHIDVAGMTTVVFEQIFETTTPAQPPAASPAPDCAGAAPGPAALVVIFTEPKSPAHEADYNRWYDDVHTGETLMLPGFTRARRYRLPAAADQLSSRPWDDRPYLTLYDVANVNCVPLARDAMGWLKEVSVEFASASLGAFPWPCWTFEQVAGAAR